MTTYVNFFGGPGSGKSVSAAEAFADCKISGHLAELVTEVAKDFVWENRKDTLAIQPYVLAKQYRNLKRIQGKVEFVITDAPILKDIIYAEGKGLPDEYNKLVLWMHNDLSPTKNYLLKPPKEKNYETVGRLHTHKEAVAIFESIKLLLDTLNIEYELVNSFDSQLN